MGVGDDGPSKESPVTGPGVEDLRPDGGTERSHGGHAGGANETRNPDRDTEAPEFSLWLQPPEGDGRIDFDAEPTRIYPLSPRTPEEIRRAMSRREKRQTKTARRMEEWPGFELQNVRNEAGIDFRLDSLEFAKKTQNAAVYFHYGGVATADVDSDDDQDLYFLNQDGRNELYLNEGDGTFQDVTEEAGVGVPDEVASSAAFADYDGDGDVDLHVTTLTGRNYLFRNQGDGTFRDVTEESGLSLGHRHSSSSVFFDYDGDGDLDLYVVNIANFTSLAEGEDGYRIPTTNVVGFPKGWAESSQLYSNQGDGTFEPVDSALENPLSWNMDVALVPEPGSPPGLYVTNIDGADTLYHNKNSGFRDVTGEVLGATPQGSFGVKVVDADGNGYFDIYVTDKHSDMMMYSDQAALSLEEIERRPKAPEVGHVHVQGDVLLGSALYLGSEEGYAERADEFGAQTFLPWGSDAGDVNADGLQDLYVTGGMEYARYVPDALLLNRGDRGLQRSEFLVEAYPREGSRYTRWNDIDCEDPPNQVWCEPHGAEDLAGEVDVMNTRSSRGVVMVDIDGDGDLDVVTNEMNARPRVLENSLMQNSSRGYLKVDLEGETAPPGGIGAVVTLKTDRGERKSFRGGKAFLAQNDRPMYFGLREGEKPLYLEVEWPSGDTDLYRDVGRDERLTLRQGEDSG